MASPTTSSGFQNWELGPQSDADATPSRWIPAEVPGAVQLDWARAEGWPPFWQHEESRRYGWMENVYWCYRARAVFAEPRAGEAVWLTLTGADHRVEVHVAGEVVATAVGPEARVAVDVSGRLQPGDTVEFLVHPAPRRLGARHPRGEADHTTKAAMSYGWDWHPRLIPLGLGGPVRLEVGPTRRWHECSLSYELAADFSSATLRLDGHVEPGDAGETFRWEVYDPDGRSVGARTLAPGAHGHFRSETIVRKPRLWWPHDQGKPELYTVEVARFGADGAARERRVWRAGLRRVELVMAPGAWETREIFPKSRNEPPATLRINGRDIFAKGSNLVPPEIFPALATGDKWRTLADAAWVANFNLLRCWGGAAMPPEAFWDRCDEIGVLVWAEFPLACNLYPDTADYLDELDAVARALLRRLRAHASLAIWSGGNELFNRWSGMTDQSLSLRLLNARCFELDPLTPFIPTSPLDGMAHGNYLFRYHDGREVFQVMPASAFTAYTEFGVPGPSSVEALKKMIPAEEWFPPRAEGSWVHHHAVGAWQGDSWLCESTLRHYFGESPDLETLVARGQWLQAEGYKAIFEEARRQKPRCAMALNWCFNDIWPCAANNSLLAWPFEPKPAYAAAKASCRPTLACARLRKFQWRAGEVFECDGWILHDAPVPRTAMEVELQLITPGMEPWSLGRWSVPEGGPGNNEAGPTWRAVLPDWHGIDRFTVRLVVVGAPQWDSSYELSFVPNRRPRTEVVGDAARLNE